MRNQERKWPGRLALTTGLAGSLVIGFAIGDEHYNDGRNVALAQEWIGDQAGSAGRQLQEWLPGHDTAQTQNQIPSADSPQPAAANSSPAVAPSPSSTVPESGTRQTVIFLDPGHAGAGHGDRTDPQSGFPDSYNHQPPESDEVYQTAVKVQEQLEQDGYKVVMSRQANDGHFLRDIANEAIEAGADEAVSIHDDHSAPSSFAQIYEQRIGSYREWKGKKEAFTDTATAVLSHQYALAMKEQREKAENHGVDITENDSYGSRGLAPGNIPLVMIWGAQVPEGSAGLKPVPWVYNEIGAKNGVNIGQYATGIANGIEAALDPTQPVAPGAPVETTTAPVATP